MKFKKGTKVEVLETGEVPSGTWWCGEIVSGNGHNYDVRHDHSLPGTDGVVVERVPRKAIRPCPPSLKCPWSWVPGDVVEVFSNGSWKLAEVSRAVDNNYFFVRFLGSSRAFKSHPSNMRLRQSWQDKKWVVTGKDFESFNYVDLSKTKHRQNLSFQIHRSQEKALTSVLYDHISIEKNAGLLEPHRRGTKRGSQFFSLPDETRTRATRKQRTFENDDMQQEVGGRNSTRLLKKVDAIVSPQKMLAEKYLQASDNSRTGYSVMETEMARPNADVRCSLARNFERSNFESDACSVGSCSGSCNPDMKHCHDPSLELCNLYDDAHSFCELESAGEHSIQPPVDVDAEIHEMELHAYRSTMEALYASGPISWEQEALMTNLRLMLHISNDEHLLELRHLASTTSGLLS